MVTGKSKSKSYLIKDRKFAEGDSAISHLALYLDSDTLIFGIQNRKTDEVECCGRFFNTGLSTTDFLRDIIKTHPFLALEFQSVTATLGQNKTAIAPAVLASEESANDLLAFTYGKPIAHSRLVPLSNADVAVVHEVDVEVEDEVKKIHPNVQWHSYAALLLDALQRRYNQNQGQLLFLEVFQGHLVIVAWKDDALQLYNWFSIQNENDILYHSMNVCQQLGIDLPECRVLVSGEVEKSGPVFQILQKYIPNLSVNYGLDYVKVSPGLSLPNKQEMAPAFNQFACVL